MSLLQTPVLGHEIELKLKLSPAHMTVLKRHPLLAENRLVKPRTASLVSIYWDTPDLALAAHGVTVRVRADGRKRIQTVKTAGDRSAALHSRQEWEWPILSDHPNTHLLASTHLAPFLDADLLDRLAPVYTTEFKRAVYRLGTDDWEVEVALDVGKVGTREASEVISEVELELYRGSPMVLVELAQRIVDLVPARLLTIPKSERGQNLLTGWQPGPTKAVPGEMDPDLTVGQAFRTIGRNCINQMLANEYSLLLNGDPEAIHQMRVALRRLRSAIRLFRELLTGPQTEAIREELRWLQACLGPARDSHVFLKEIVAPVIAAHPDTAPLLALHSHWSTEIAGHVKHAMDSVAHTRFTKLILQMVAWIEAGEWQEEPATAALRSRPITEFARLILAKQDRRLRRAATDDPIQLPMEELHNLRILCKQLRYTAEFFAALFSRKAVRAHLTALADLQEILGQLHDIAVASERLGLSTNMLAGEDGRAWAAGLVAGWHTGRLPALLAQVDGAWEKYCAAQRYWKA